MAELQRQGTGVDTPEYAKMETVVAEMTAKMEARFAEVKQGQREIKAVADETLKNTVELKQMTTATRAQLEKTRTALLRGMFEATGVLVPTSIVILAEKRPDDEDADPKSRIEAWSDGASAVLDELGVGEQAVEDGKAVTEKRSWFGRVTAFFASPTAEAANAAEKLLNDHDTYLYLVDEVTGKSVVQAPYPIVIKKQSATTKKWLPYMKFGLAAMQIANGVSSIVGCVVPGASLIRPRTRWWTR